jgi:sporulation protein YlmC with PRC-barrel domain
MKQITVNVKEDRIEQLLSILEEYNFDWVSNEDTDFDVPQWQIDEVEHRSAESDKNPEILIPWNQVKSRLEQKLK